jgi:TetR/AcrR family transcriptional repressor of nem operon
MLVAYERKRQLRDPKRTRERLLQAAFREVHRSGFQSASIDAILAATNVTKGALYYHFESKEALGYAVVEEKIAKLTRDRWLRPMQSEGEAIEILIGVVRRIPRSPQDVRAGCPLLLLSQEMSPLDEQFRKRLERIFRDWQEGIATLLRKGKSRGTVRHDLNPDEAASFLIAAVEGYCTLAKNAQNAKVWKAGIRNIVGWLRSLRPLDNYNGADRIAIRRSASNHIMKGRTNDDKDHSAAQESTRNGSLRAGRCSDLTGTGKGQRIGRA